MVLNHLFNSSLRYLFDKQIKIFRVFQLEFLELWISASTEFMDTIFICSFAGLGIIAKMLVVTGQVAGGKLIKHVPINFAPQHSGNVAQWESTTSARTRIYPISRNKSDTGWRREWLWRYRLPTLTYSQTMFWKRGINPFKVFQRQRDVYYSSKNKVYRTLNCREHSTKFAIFFFLNNIHELYSIRSEYSYNFHILNIYHFFGRWKI